MDITIEALKILFWWSAIAAACTYLHDASFNRWYARQSRKNQKLVIDNYLSDKPEEVSMLRLLVTFLCAWPFFVLDHVLTGILCRRSVWDGLIEEIEAGHYNK